MTRLTHVISGCAPSTGAAESSRVSGGSKAELVAAIARLGAVVGQRLPLDTEASGEQVVRADTCPSAAARVAPPARAAPAFSPPASALAELREAIGYVNPGVRALELKHENERAKGLAREQAAERDRSRQIIREQLGEWSKDSAARLQQTQPVNAREVKDAKRLGQHVWAIARQAVCGSVRDLAYAVQQMTLRAPIEAVGCWVVEAMGLGADGVALRQLYSLKARRKLVRSFVLWMAGENTRLRKIAGSPSRRVVRGVKRVPQTLLARIAAVGDKPWHRSTTTRDSNESHEAGLWRRTRLPRALVHESERCGESQQVVSRYWMELPRQPKSKSRMAPPSPLGSVYAGVGFAGVVENPLGWVAEQGKQAIVYAMHAVKTVRRSLLAPIAVPGLMAPVLHAPP